MTFDDHDYGINNGDKHFIHRNASQQLFWDFQKVSKDSLRRKQNGVYSSETIRLSPAFSYKVIMLDTRSNKDRKGIIYGDFLGKEQWDWLGKELSFDDVDQIPNFVIIASSIQVLPNDKFIEETWSDFPLAREKLLRLIIEVQKVSKVILLSGDVHSAEFLQCQYDKRDSALSYENIFEFTSSGLTHSVTRRFSNLHPASR